MHIEASFHGHRRLEFSPFRHARRAANGGKVVRLNVPKESRGLMDIYAYATKIPRFGRRPTSAFRIGRASTTSRRWKRARNGRGQVRRGRVPLFSSSAASDDFDEIADGRDGSFDIDGSLSVLMEHRKNGITRRAIRTGRGHGVSIFRATGWKRSSRPTVETFRSPPVSTVAESRGLLTSSAPFRARSRSNLFGVIENVQRIEFPLK